MLFSHLSCVQLFVTPWTRMSDNYLVFFFLCLTYFTKRNNRPGPIYTAANCIISVFFFLWLSTIPLCAYVYVCMYVCVCVCLDFFSWIYTQEQNCQVVWQFNFQFLSNLHTVFHSGCTTLRSHQQCVGGFLFLHTHFPAFVSYRLLMVVILTDGRGYLIEVAFL